LEANIDDFLADLKLTGERGIELGILHERGQVYLAQGEYQKAREVEEEVLRQLPDFTSAQNNLSLISFAQGNVDEAIATAQKVLEIQPDNIHALSNLTRFHCLKGQIEQAKPFAERLKASQANAWDVWTKKVEALNYLADDEGILEVFDRAKASGDLKSSDINALFYHFVAVALARLGQTQKAREQWQEALKRSPGLELAQENLEDFKKPIGQRHAPWSFYLSNWLTKKTIDDLVTLISPTAKSKDETLITKATKRFLAEHPDFAQIVPILLDQGDPQGREFAFRLASITKTPEMLTVLRDFALGQSGPDEMRHQAAIKVSEAGLLPSESVHMWIQGEWREVNLISYEFHEESTATHSRKVNQWLGQAISLMKTSDKKDAEEAENLLKKALEVEPDSPDLLNNLAGAYELQGRSEESIDLMRKITELYPDYIFARVTVARLHIRQGETDTAEVLLKPLISRKRFHFDEFAAFCNAYLELLLAQHKRDAARAWLKMWEGVDPEHPDIMKWKVRIEGPGLLEKLSKMSNWGRST
jgi:tetratricopeptide (TPR) repeat protein